MNRPFYGFAGNIQENQRFVINFAQKYQPIQQNFLESQNIRIIDENNYPISPPSPVKNSIITKSNEVFRS